MPADVIVWLTIAGMVAATLSTRLGGFWIMQRVTVTPALEAFLRALASSVVVAAIAPAAWHGDLAARVAIVVATILMWFSRRAWLAMLGGMAAASAVRLSGVGAL